MKRLVSISCYGSARRLIMVFGSSIERLRVIAPLLCSLGSVHCGSDEPAANGAGSSSGGGSSVAGKASTGGSGSKGGESPSFGGEVTVVPGAPSCGLADNAAFCEQFDAPAEQQGRAGELDSARWTGSRAAPQLASRDNLAVGIPPGTLPPCRAELPGTVLPPQDALICDPSQAWPSNHLLVVAAAQNYGQNSYRITQPFDFAGRVGKIVFDAEGYLVNSLLGWISLDITEDPISAPGFAMVDVPNDEGTQIPKNGVELQFQDNCAGFKEPPVMGLRMLAVYTNYVGNFITPPDHVCPKVEQGHLNHFEVAISANKIEVYASDSSAGGGEFGDLQLLASADVDLPFTRGYVSITTHNHATLKYSENGALDAWVARWDNVGFDGPKLTGTREYEVADSLTVLPDPRLENQMVTNIGYRIADAAVGPAQALQFKDVDVAGMNSAKLSLSAWYLDQDMNKSYVLQYRFNGGDWHDRPLNEAEGAILTGGASQGQLAQVMDVPIGELVSGDNTLEVVTKNAPQNYPPVVSNVNLSLSE